MKLGLFDRTGSLAELRADVTAAAEHGVASYWLAQDFGPDALTMIGALGHDVPMRIGTAVVPAHPRHPMVLAQQALTVNSLIGGRLALGIGPSHPSVVGPCWGLSYDRPADYLEEYLQALTAALGQHVRYRGERITARGDLDVPGASAPPVLVSALGPRMLELAGRLATGTITWMVGPRTLAEFTVPTIRSAARAAGRAEPEVVAGVPVCVTDDPEGARKRALGNLSWYDHQPAYRAMLDREGMAHPLDMAVIGDAAAVRRALDDYRAAGVTTLAVRPSGSEPERERTRDLVRHLSAEHPSEPRERRKPPPDQSW